MRSAAACAIFVVACRGGGAVSIAAEEPAAVPSAHEVRIDGRRLHVDRDRCVLTFADRAVDLRLPSPCQFVVDKTGRPQVVRTVNGPTLLVISSEPRAGTDRCNTKVRAAVVAKDEVRISGDMQSIRSCSLGPKDETMFVVLAASTTKKENRRPNAP